ncbi:hypothetical protein CHH49_10900 [Terribacillus saccharophilus]|uniref:hypothetical protein n=1 Tax=Terribacillus saccharophilus TaxID=361277 RepID=UPI000BA55035|nr:hypothetical protein [Terribacillus saccharophilus]PAF21400.1 hypothetical protein CHH49_10900 [Terribacillus saccharophilus]
MEIFLDSTFQWAGVAAIISFLAACLNGISIYIHHLQGIKNRKTSTLLSLRIEDLKEVRKESIICLSIIKGYLKYDHQPKELTKDDSIVREIIDHLASLESKLYLHSIHSSSFSTLINTCQIKLLMIKTTEELTEVLIDLQTALQEYSESEYKEIESML